MATLSKMLARVPAFDGFTGEPLTEEDHITFAPGDDSEWFRRELSITRTDWLAMGSPERVAVTIAPGDPLNAEPVELEEAI